MAFLKNVGNSLHKKCEKLKANSNLSPTQVKSWLLNYDTFLNEFNGNIINQILTFSKICQKFIQKYML